MPAAPRTLAVCTTLTALTLLTPTSPSRAATPHPGTAVLTAGRGDGGFAWSVRPARVKGGAGRDYFVYSATPGQRISDSVSITNGSDRALGFRVYATDAFNTQDGAFALLTADKRATDVGSWVSFKAGAYQIKPGATATVPFSLTVPAGATPGDHSGGVIAAVSEQVTGAMGRRLNVDRRIAARVYLRVGGATSPSLHVDSLTAAASGGGLDVTYRVRNTGNVRMTAGARISAATAFGISLGEPATRAIPELLPGNAYTFTEHLSHVPAVGRLTSTVRLTPADPTTGRPLSTPPTTRTTALWAISRPVLAALALLLAAALYTARRTLRRVRRTSR